jgi:hypothetical protein
VGIKTKVDHALWHMPIISALGRPRQQNHEFEGSLSLHKETVSKNKMKNTDYL